MQPKEAQLFFNNQLVIDQLLRQIEKDFDLLPDTFHYIIKTNEIYQDLLVLLTPFVKNELNKNFSLFLNRLYRIDIDEKKLQKIIKENTDEEYHLAITGLILQKEMQKIIMRKVYENISNYSN